MAVLEGVVALKMRYLGGVFVGQDLCHCRIEVGINAVVSHTWRAGRIVKSFSEDDPARVEILKSKLRAYLQRMKNLGRWKWTKTRAGVVYIEIYYPSRSWLDNTGQCRLFCEDVTF